MSWVFNPFTGKFDAVKSPAYGCLLFDTDPQRVADSVSVVAGTITSGDVTSTQTTNQTYLVVNESAKFDIQFTFSGLSGIPAKCTFVGRYEGSAAHHPFLYIWNYSTLAWDRFTTSTTEDFPSSTTDYSPIFNTAIDANHLNGDEAKLRIYHPENPVGTHNIYIDFINLVGESIHFITAGTPVQMTGFTDGPAAGTTIDSSVGTITILEDGDYQLGHYASFGGSAGITVSLNLYIDDGFLTTLFRRRLNSEGDVGSASSDAIRTFTAGQVISYKFVSNVSDSFISLVAMRVMATKVS